MIISKQEGAEDEEREREKKQIRTKQNKKYMMDYFASSE